SQRSFFVHDPATTEIYTLSLHDALPIFWTPQREDTALSYAGEILDEDELPQDRAADRAERFAGYRDKRTAEAIAQAERYEEAPRSEEHTSELQSRENLVCRLLLEKKKTK